MSSAAALPAAAAALFVSLLIKIFNLRGVPVHGAVLSSFCKRHKIKSPFLSFPRIHCILNTKKIFVFIRIRPNIRVRSFWTTAEEVTVR